MRVRFRFVIVIFFFSVFLVSLNGDCASANVYIRADGSVDPSTAPILKNGDVYTLTGDIYDELSVLENNAVVDGAGYTVQDVYVKGTTNVTVKNFKAEGFMYGINLFQSSNCFIIDNQIENTSSFGIYLTAGCNSNVVSGNNITRNQWIGLYVNVCDNNTITYNNFISNLNYSALALNYAFDNVIHHNNFVDNTNDVTFSNDASNIWDNGHQGNYWSKYNGVDSNNDGVGDSQYTLDETNIDRFPLVNTAVVPEFPQQFVLTIIMVVVLLTAIFWRKKGD